MDLGRSQIAYDNQEPDLVDVDPLIESRIEEIKYAVTSKGNIYYKGKPYRAAQHVYDWMDFESMYNIIEAAHTMSDEELGKFAKTVFTKAIEKAAENDIETEGV